MRRRTLVALATVTAGSIAAFDPSSRAQGAYPQRPTTRVAAAPAGGGTDLITRLQAEQLFKDLGWSLEDFIGMTVGATSPQVIVVPKEVPADGLGSFIAYAKANPSKLNCESFGPGSWPLSAASC